MKLLHHFRKDFIENTREHKHFFSLRFRRPEYCFQSTKHMSKQISGIKLLFPLMQLKMKGNLFSGGHKKTPRPGRFQILEGLFPTIIGISQRYTHCQRPLCPQSAF